jgi:hypothetical protein
MTYGFVAYIDESGDDGLKRIRPLDAGGSSEWFILSAVMVRSSNEKAVGRWQREILARFNHSQRHDIHYRKLAPIKKRIACEVLAAQPLRLFVVMSNKKNIKGYRNPRTHPEKNYLYWWLTRLLLERVTRFCAEASHVIYQEPRPIKMIFSLRGGMSYDRLIAYLRLLRLEAEIQRAYRYAEYRDSCMESSACTNPLIESTLSIRYCDRQWVSTRIAVLPRGAKRKPSRNDSGSATPNQPTGG